MNKGILNTLTNHVYTTALAEDIANSLDLMDIEQQEKFVSALLQKMEDDFNGHVIVFFRDKAQEMIDEHEKKKQ